MYSKSEPHSFVVKNSPKYSPDSPDYIIEARNLAKYGNLQFPKWVYEFESVITVKTEADSRIETFVSKQVHRWIDEYKKIREKLG